MENIFVPRQNSRVLALSTTSKSILEAHSGHLTAVRLFTFGRCQSQHVNRRLIPFIPVCAARQSERWNAVNVIVAIGGRTLKGDSPFLHSGRCGSVMVPQPGITTAGGLFAYRNVLAEYSRPCYTLSLCVRNSP
ncbi:hypothetical protein ACFFPL_07890 [Paeniglutamicibacter sulfureus]